MERLTERTADGILVKEDYEKESGIVILKTLYSCYGEKPNPHYTNCEEGYCAMEKLADYEDAEEQGRLVIPPCKVGDTVYLIDRDENNKFKVYKGKWERVSLVQTSKDGSFNLCGEISYDIYDCFYNDGRMMKHGMYVGQERTKIGEVVFLTKSEAEAKLKELRGAEKGSME